MKQKQLNTGEWQVTFGAFKTKASTLEEAQQKMLELLGGAC